MIPFHFDYYRPDTLSEAVQIYNQLSAGGKFPVYYSGGSEIITMARAGSIRPGAVIDVKAIPECSFMGYTEDCLVIGAGVALSTISESKIFPLLGTTAGRIADHTNQCRITLGGNMCGTIIYRETVLPLLLCDCTVVICSTDGLLRTVPMTELFQQTVQIQKGELVVQVLIHKKYLDLPYVHVKKTKNEKIDYSILTIAAIKYEDRIRMAFSGVCEYPFRSSEIEEMLNSTGYSASEKVRRIAGQMPGAYLNNIAASASYRTFVLKNSILSTLHRFEEI